MKIMGFLTDPSQFEATRHTQQGFSGAPADGSVRSVKLFFIAGLILLALLVLGLAVANRTASPAGGLENGRLKPCPESPNCVSSSDPGGTVPPLEYGDGPAAARERLKQLMQTQPRTALVQETETYLHYAVTSRVCRFVDDLEFLFDDDTRRIHVRSASRLGYSDLGANLARVEMIRAEWEKR